MTSTVRISSPTKNLRALCLLPGTIRNHILPKQLNRPVSQLPMPDGRSIYDHWRIQWNKLLVEFEMDIDLPMFCEASNSSEYARSASLRGTAGILHDIAREFHDDDIILVASEDEVLFHDLSSILIRMAEFEADICLAENTNNSPTDLMLIRCSTLRNVSSVGFCDLKEQLLPSLVEKFRVSVCRFSSDVSYAVTSPDEYMKALFAWQQKCSQSTYMRPPFNERWQHPFNYIEPNYSILHSGNAINSIILSDRVSPEARVIQSIVAPLAVVRPKEMVFSCYLYYEHGVTHHVPIKIR